MYLNIPELASRKVLADCVSVASRTSIKETCADMDREPVVSSLLGFVSKEKKDRGQNVVQTLRDRQHLHKILERQAELAARGEKLWLCKGYTKLRQMWRLSFGKREIRTSLFMRSIRSSSPNDYSYSEKIEQKIAKQLKNGEEFVSKKQI